MNSREVLAVGTADALLLGMTSKLARPVVVGDVCVEWHRYALYRVTDVVGGDGIMSSGATASRCPDVLAYRLDTAGNEIGSKVALTLSDGSSGLFTVTP
jgi:hypothetical protein